MAAAPTVVPSSSSLSFISVWNYDVFLSFRGEDTRANFTRDLYAALDNKRIETFKDDEKLRIGDVISEALEKAIKESRFAIIIFSKNYANSKWCLQELALIMERWKNGDQKVFPVFLAGVDPLDVQHQEGSFGEPFREHEKNHPEKVERWRSALTAAAQLSRFGWSLKDFGDKEKLIEKIVKDVSTALNRPPPGIEMSTGPIIINQPSTQSILKQVLDCCKGDLETGIIGVCGMGGVGKTTLAKKVNNHFIKDFCFEIVMMVTVSNTPNIQDIQITIGNHLGLDLSRDREDERRKKLSIALRKKKFLLILDDVWRKLVLEDVGIPCPPTNKSKILLTSRNQDACTDMGASKIIYVKPLQGEEPWKLFITIVGEHVAADDIKPFAEKIVGKCKGLPLAIVTVARAMVNRGPGVGVWENAWRQMKQSAEDLRGMDEVFGTLKFSFDSLENDLLRSLFLYFACYPEDFNVTDAEMLNYWVREGLPDKLGSLKAARDKGEDMIESLKIACMLEAGEIRNSVRVHDMMRELAIWITTSRHVDSSSPKFLIRIGKSVEETPPADEWQDASTISLIDTKIKKLPELGQTCQKLTTLLFRWNCICTNVPQENFLQHMEHLSVLDLSYSEMEYLPDSFSRLVKLQVLRLHSCEKLKALPLSALRMLRRLQVLDLGWCSELDQQILKGYKGGASNLRHLDVKFSKVSIPAGVISGLHKLEVFRAYASNKIKWKVSDSEDHEKRNGNGSHSIIDVRELSRLTRLRSFTICFQDIIISDWFKPLANKIDALSLYNCTVEKQEALQALDCDKSRYLEQLVIENCPGVKCVRIASTLTILENCVDFEMVLDRGEVSHDRYYRRELTLKKLPKLRRTWASLKPLSCFGQLMLLVIKQCDTLKMIFTKEMTCLFTNLREIKVVDCGEMEVLIEAKEDQVDLREKFGSNIDGGVISPFPRLEVLKLEDLPTLTDVCTTNHILHCPLIQEVTVKNCGRLKKDPLHIRNEDGLLVITAEQWKKRN